MSPLRQTRGLRYKLREVSGVERLSDGVKGADSQDKEEDGSQALLSRTPLLPLIIFNFSMQLCFMKSSMKLLRGWSSWIVRSKSDALVPASKGKWQPRPPRKHSSQTSSFATCNSWPATPMAASPNLERRQRHRGPRPQESQSRPLRRHRILRRRYDLPRPVQLPGYLAAPGRKLLWVRQTLHRAMWSNRRRHQTRPTHQRPRLRPAHLPTPRGEQAHRLVRTRQRYRNRRQHQEVSLPPPTPQQPRQQRRHQQAHQRPTHQTAVRGQRLARLWRHVQLRQQERLQQPCPKQECRKQDHLQLTRQHLQLGKSRQRPPRGWTQRLWQKQIQQQPHRRQLQRKQARLRCHQPPGQPQPAQQR
eukprot:m.216799 g.216799  ORF g.216799 m.216799 type:complete len:360 (+) comp18660_c1_seq5:1106-2185(+)